MLSLIAWFLAGTACAAQLQQEAEPGYGLPPDPDHPIIVYDSIGGMQARSSSEPLLSIRANGNVVLGNPWGQGRRMESRLSATKLQQLLGFIVEQNRFFELDTADIMEQIRERQRDTGQLFRVMDAGTSVVKVSLADRQHEVQFYALGIAAKRFPAVDALQRLRAIDRELWKLMTWVQIGGDEGAQTELALVNEHLRQTHPDIEPMTLLDLVSAYNRSDGHRTVHYSRRTAASHSGSSDNISIDVDHPPQGAAKITVRLNP